MNNPNFNYDANQMLGLALAVVYGYEIGKTQAENIAKQTIADSDKLWEQFASGFGDLFGGDK